MPSPAMGDAPEAVARIERLIEADGYGLCDLASQAGRVDKARFADSMMLQSERLLLRGLEASDLNSTYLNWLRDPAVNRHLETRFLPQTAEALHAYWQAHRDDPSSPWFAICITSEGRHIGNIKLGPIQWMHRRADISLFIGEQSAWGQGYGSEAIALIRDWAFRELDLQKLSAGIYACNQGSRRAFEKCGFVLEGTLRDEVFCDGIRQDVWRMGLPRSLWSSRA